MGKEKSKKEAKDGKPEMMAVVYGPPPRPPTSNLDNLIKLPESDLNVFNPPSLDSNEFRNIVYGPPPRPDKRKEPPK